MKKKSFVFLGVLLICMLMFSSMAFASEKAPNVSKDPIKVLSIESVSYDKLPADVKDFVDKQEKNVKAIKQKEAEGTVTPAASYFANAYISCSDPLPVFSNTTIYVTTSAYPGGLWQFEAVDLAANYGVIPVSPTWDAFNANGVNWSWGSLPGESKTVKIVCQIAHSGDYKLHVWGGASLFAHADFVKMVTAKVL